MSKWSAPTKRRRQIRNNCARKVAYFSHAETEAAIEEVRAAGKLKVDDPIIYVCVVCHHFHWATVPMRESDTKIAAEAFP
ncbi:hypothetical protein IB244_17150 [Rhizobium sp. RHZ02]|uniref:hypothetical protein n=1 Tax=Rhizobium sp. RHZ02 TaxID=2769306 RepID=UPI00177E7179|nr:hypothetical protein [Rhizobium sp. RHZ02]MBD9453272.1 hypothetical protein [Rhizobium sp. RHZ02]